MALQITGTKVYTPQSANATVSAVTATATAVARPAIVTGASGAAQPTGPTGTFTLAFEDLFSGTSLDTSKWAASWFNGGSQNNVATSAANVTISGGNLILTKSSSTIGASVNTNPSDAATTGYQYNTGVVEARILFPGNGTQIYNWAAWWTTGQNWPTTGENDIAEVLSAGNMTVNYHSASGAHNQGSVPGYWGDAFHIYTLHRKATSSDVYYDGTLVKSYATDDSSAPQYMVINVGTSTNAQITGTASQIKVDYVRAWT